MVLSDFVLYCALPDRSDPRVLCCRLYGTVCNLKRWTGSVFIIELLLRFGFQKAISVLEGFGMTRA